MSLSGPSFGPAAGGPAKRLVILLHGIGADGNDLIGLAPAWADMLPDTVFVSPNAPFPCDMAPYGHQWFSLQDRSPARMLAGIRATAPILDGFIDDTLAAHGLDDGLGATVRWYLDNRDWCEAVQSDSYQRERLGLAANDPS